MAQVERRGILVGAGEGQKFRVAIKIAEERQANRRVGSAVAVGAVCVRISRRVIATECRWAESRMGGR